MDWIPRAEHLFAARPTHVTPLRLRAWLSSPVALDPADPLTLEGLLQTTMILLVTGRLPDDVFSAHRGPTPTLPIPLAEVRRAGTWVHAASVGRPPEGATWGVRYLRKRARVDHLPIPRGRGVIHTNGGPLKSTQIPMQVRHSPCVDFHVQGDRERLDVLLPDALALGRGRAGGLGHIWGWEVAPDPEDRALVYQGVPQRPLPVESPESADAEFVMGTFDLRETTCRAPYWHQGSRTLCAVGLP